MNPERETDIERICDAALLRNPGDRERFLAEACAGDEALRREVESLLAHELTAERFLESPAALSIDDGDGSHHVLTVGQRIGTYTILSTLGSGGMGEVYRARDTKLGREVGIKVLPSAFTTDRERLARFEREARMLAALNHPHIATIYGLEDVDGVRALVLELVEGQTLEERLTAGALPLSETLAIAVQVAEALEAAQEKGIVHRDLKPANIKITAAGVVKVLDFGIARVAAQQDGKSAGDSPTVTRDHTREGVSLGTAAYMSPEQARGQALDQRTDIWSFGCVLYEMLTGRSPFEGLTPADVIAGVLNHQPDWNALPIATPIHVRHVLKRCLEKDRNHRLHHVADARIYLDEPLVQPSPPAVPIRSRRRFERLLWVSALAVVAVTASAVAVRVSRRSLAAPMGEVRFEITTPPTDDPESLAISSDGRRLVFVANSDGHPILWLRSLDSTTPRALPGTENASGPFWSPDNRSVGFFAEGKLRRIDVEQ